MVLLGITIVTPWEVGAVRGTTAPPGPRQPGTGKSARTPAGPPATATAGATRSPAGTTARQGPLEEEDQSMTLPKSQGWATVFTGSLFFHV